VEARYLAGAGVGLLRGTDPGALADAHALNGEVATELTAAREMPAEDTPTWVRSLSPEVQPFVAGALRALSTLSKAAAE
jgi:hypothetical protein